MKSVHNLKKAKKGQRALVRVDLNIHGEDISHSLRVERIIPTIRFLLEKEYEVVLMSHLGRPAHTGGQKQKQDRFSLRPFASVLSKKIGEKVVFEPGLSLEGKEKIHLLENLRFHTGEEKNDLLFAKKLSKLGDVYVNDAFAVSHRLAASICAITKFLPSYAGLLLEEEIHALSQARAAKLHPFTLVLGGVKISDKLPLVRAFEKKADFILIGGGVANTLLRMQGVPVGESVSEDGVWAKFSDDTRRKMHLPVDVQISQHKILDIGPFTARRYANIIRSSKYVLWNGPLGDTDQQAYWSGSRVILEATQSSRAQVVIGGGETTSFVLKQKKQLPKNIFLSTGGGAMLEYLAGKKLPGIEVLK